MTLDEYFCVGETVTLGSHRFDAEAIKAFAKKFDPQAFHLDKEKARASVFNALCASGWHTASAWMKYNVAVGMASRDRQWAGPGPEPVIGPSPGIKNLKWLKPVFAGETVTYTRKVTEHRPLSSRPGWRVLSVLGAGHDSAGDKVLEFESGVLVKA